MSVFRFKTKVLENETFLRMLGQFGITYFLSFPFSVVDAGFSWGGDGANSQVGVLTYYFAENCMKMMEFGIPGGRSSLAAP